MFQHISFYVRNIFFFKFYLNIFFISFLIIWIFEWIFIFEYHLLYYNYTYIFFFYKLPLLLLICFLLYIYIWGILNWKRTQYGKFTRGDRKLWFKGYASFWFIEITTLTGVLISAAWMNWGPLPLFPRNFFVSKKSFIIEITYFTYILWILYLMRYSMKFNKFKNQILYSSLILLIISLIIWRDILIIFGKENLNLKNNSKWKFIKTITVIYSFFPKWWINCYIDQNDFLNKNYLFFSLKNIFKNVNFINFNDIFLKDLNISEYNKYQILSFQNNKNWINNSLILNFFFFNNKNFFFFNKNNYFNFNFNNFTLDSFLYYPRKIGFLTKKLAIWIFFFFLKIWHHFILFIWWFFFIQRLISRKKNSYSLLSICHFNIYCCFLISLVIYIFSFFPWYELFFKMNKTKIIMRSIIIINSRLNYGFDYIIELFLNYFYSFSYFNNWFYLLNYTWYFSIRIIFIYIFNYYENYELQFVINFFNLKIKKIEYFY